MAAEQAEEAKARSPLIDLRLPLSECHFGNNDDVEGPPIANLLLGFEALNQSQDRDRLDGLAKTHLVSQDSVQVCLIELE